MQTLAGEKQNFRNSVKAEAERVFIYLSDSDVTSDSDEETHTASEGGETTKKADVSW